MSKPVSMSRRDITSVLARITMRDWENESFSYDKAFICSIFSAWAYAAIDQKEKNEAAFKRIRVFRPSIIYDELILDKQEFDFKQFVAEQRLGRQEDQNQGSPVELLDIYTTEFVVVVSFRLNGIIFIAIRGTAKFKDWLVDGYFPKKFPWIGEFKHCGYHSGFYNAIKEYPERLDELLHKWKATHSLIYVTGHSLGGAMSAILFDLWNGPTPYDPRLASIRPLAFRGYCPGCPRLHSAYTFGMPRYANANTLELFEGFSRVHPHHVFNPWDLVPIALPKFLDYADPINRYRSVRSETLLQRKRWKVMSHHRVENYVEDISNLVFLR